MVLPKIAALQFSSSELAQKTKPTRVYETLDWDFEEGDFRMIDGKTVKLTELDYLKVWMQKTLKTAWNSLIYDGTNYGSNHYSLIGRNFHPNYSKSEYQRMIREALLQNDAISGVDNFEFSQDGARLTIRFNVSSIYGSTTGAVTV